MAKAKTPVDLRLLVGKVDIHNVILEKAGFNRGEALEHNPQAPMEVEGRIEVSIHIAEGARSAWVRLTMKAVGTPVEETLKGLSGFEIEATFRSSYGVGESDLSEDDRHQALRLILVNSAHNHLWPYWREFAQQATLRMGIPALVVPLLLVVPRVEEVGPQAGSEVIAKKPKRKGR